MSSPLHTARCVACAGRVAEIELGPTTAVGVHFPSSAFYALALLHEAALGTVYEAPGRVWRRPRSTSLASALTFDEVLAHSALERPDAAKDAVTRRYVTSAAYVATRNFAPALWPRDPSGYRDPGIAPRDPRMIAAMDAVQRVFDAARRDVAREPHATLRIEVTDPAWVAHLAPSMMWDVYAFDEAARMLA